VIKVFLILLDGAVVHLN